MFANLFHARNRNKLELKLAVTERKKIQPQKNFAKGTFKYHMTVF